MAKILIIDDIGEIDERVEAERRCNPEERPGQRLSGRLRSRLLVKDAEIENEHGHEQDEQANPEDRYHGGPS